MVSFAWGNFSNGRIPDSAMTSIGGGNFLRADAAEHFRDFAAAFYNAFGEELLVSEGYRDYATQVSLKNYWTSLGQSYKAAAPGGSIHGWGLAIDIYSWVYGGSTGTVQHKWLRESAPSFGFDWYTTGAPIDEPWHFDYVGGATAASTTKEDDSMSAQDVAELKNVIEGLKPFIKATVVEEVRKRGGFLLQANARGIALVIEHDVLGLTGEEVEQLVNIYGWPYDCGDNPRAFDVIAAAHTRGDANTISADYLEKFGEKIDGALAAIAKIVKP